MSKRIIDIDDEYRVTVDEFNFTLQVFNEGGLEVRNPKTGETTISKPKWENHVHPYYPNMRLALAAVIESKLIDDEDITTITQYLDKAKELGILLGGRFSL